MPVEYVWGVVASLGFLAFGLTLKVGDLRRSLHFANKELSRIREEFDLFKQKHNEAISASQEKMVELEKIIQNLTKDSGPPGIRAINLE